MKGKYNGEQTTMFWDFGASQLSCYIVQVSDVGLYQILNAQHAIHLLYYDLTRELNTAMIDEKLHELVKEEIQKDSEVKEYGYTLEEVTNPFMFVEKKKELDTIKNDLSYSDDVMFDWYYEDYENTCTWIDCGIDCSYAYSGSI